MKDAKSAEKRFNFWQKDNKIIQILTEKGVEIFPSFKAWERFGWTRRYFKTKPREGYFIWVKDQIDFPLTTFISIASPGASQELNNLVVIEKGIRVKIGAACSAAKKNLQGSHKAKGKMLLKEGASLQYDDVHKWGEGDTVQPDYEFFLAKGARMVYNYKNLFPPQSLKMRTVSYLKEKSRAQFNSVVNGINSDIRIDDVLFLKGEGSQGVVKIRAIGRKNSSIRGNTKIVADAPSRGHLDCQGLMVDRDSRVSLIPALVCNNKDAQLSHEAAIGRISDEQLTYLRMRGLTEKEAIDLICAGFLKI